jgi:thiol-disulfide isomerase/thioredoxin
LRVPPKRTPLLLAVLLLGFAASAAPRAAAADADGWDVVDEPASAFALEDLSGGRLRSADLAGRIVIVDFWATWCGPCLKELPELLDYHRRIQDSRDLTLLSFNVTEDREDVVDFVRDRHIPYPVYLADELLGRFEVVAFPTKLVIDMRKGAPGKVRFRREGYTPVASLERRVKALLAEKP